MKKSVVDWLETFWKLSAQSSIQGNQIIALSGGCNPMLQNPGPDFQPPTKFRGVQTMGCGWPGMEVGDSCEIAIQIPNTPESVGARDQHTASINQTIRKPAVMPAC